MKLCGCLFLCCELCSGNIGAISITSFLNSTLIKTFGDLSYENSSTVNPVQATLSSHLKISKTRDEFSDDVQKECRLGMN